MDERSCWALIETIASETGIADRRTIGVDEASAQALWNALRTQFGQLPEATAAAVYRHTDALMRKAYTPGLLAAAVVIHGAVTDDCFEYFREWLILQGQEVYTRAVDNPDSLADYLSDLPPERTYAQFEGLKATLIMLMDERNYDAEAFYTSEENPVPDIDCWADDEIALRLPRLVALLGL